MSVKFDYPARDQMEGATHFFGDDECSHQKEHGPHYHIEIEREPSDKGLGSADVAIVLDLVQAEQLRYDLALFLVEAREDTGEQTT